MKVALIRTKHFKEEKRGVDYYADRLFASLKKESDIDISWRDYDHFEKYEGFDIVHVPFFEPYFFGLPIKVAGKLIVTIHDATRLVFPEQFPAGPRGKIEWFLQRVFLKKMDHVLTDSEVSKKDISRLMKIPEAKITVTYLAADQAFRPIADRGFLNKVAEKYKLPSKYALYVGGANWNKNVLSLCHACSKLNFPLVMVNKVWTDETIDRSNLETQQLDLVRNFVDNNPLFNRVGFVSTDELAAIYNLASVYVQPSHYEGFGLPLLEAMSCGTPTIANKTSSLVEIGGDSSVYLESSDSDAIKTAITRVLSWSDAKKEAVKKASILEAKKFSWKKTAHTTLETYKKVLSTK